jgi:guanine deaminase
MGLTATDQDQNFMRRAIRLAAEHMRAHHGGPFGAVLTRDARIIAEGWNQVTTLNDPTAHAEINAIRGAATALGTFQLRGCVLYSSCEPCPMCLGAAFWARIERVVFAATRQDAAEAGFDDEVIYEEIARPHFARKLPMKQSMRDLAIEVFAEWQRLPDKVLY